MKILNIGSLNYDFVYSINHIVKPGETEAASKVETFAGGKGLNQSIALSRAGSKVYHAGMLGTDGGMLLDTCRENNIDTSYIKTVEGKSGHAIIQVDENGQNSILLYGGSNRSLTKEYINEVLDCLDKGDWLLLQNEVNLLSYIIDKAHQKGIKIALNPSPFDAAITECDLSKVTLFLLNEIEGGQITGKTSPNEILDCMIDRYKQAKIVLTLGKQGVIYRDSKNETSHSIFKVKAVDTTAAGDTFTGYFMHSIINDLSIKEALELSSKASAIAVSKPGATNSIPNMKEVIETELDTL
ncbi:MAG: ribokinase [Bacillota bacterium]|nr:ribokinase [Bacillota bacterium]